MKKKTMLWLLAAAVLCCGIMSIVDGVIRPNYWIKSAVKLLLFLGVPFLMSRRLEQLRFGVLFRFRVKAFLPALGLGLGLYLLILLAYWLVTSLNLFDFSGIAGQLSSNAGVHRGNFLFVSLYISFVNSLLEEFFFRGFLFMSLKRVSSRPFAYGFSAAAFALYHMGMVSGWFSPLLYLLVMVGLVAGGVIFNFLNEKQETIYTSWLVHMFVNFAINTIGFQLMA